LRTENVRPAEHAAPTDDPQTIDSEPVGEPVKVASRDEGPGSRYKPDSIPNVQPNPFYRPEAKSATAGAGAGAIASPEVGKQANRAAFQRTWSDARDLVERGKLPQALAALTAFYDHPDLTPAEQKQLQKTLDSLAGRVIYSTEIYPTENDIAQSHTVRTDETLMDIAARHDTQWQLLQNINGVRDPLVLIPRTQIKVIHGKFRAEVSISSKSLTLFIDKYYAGRFVCTFGLDPMPAPGTYTVRDKREGRDYYPKQGRTIAALRPDNPYGGHWIDLGNEICIHGSAENLRPEMERTAGDWGCISLAPRDAADVYGILSLGSTVTIKR
jgi:lipoprotein-anchoring transpeptidase ErfK/SrfK